MISYKINSKKCSVSPMTVRKYTPGPQRLNRLKNPAPFPQTDPAVVTIIKIINL
jgi:hypothetical protein